MNRTLLLSIGILTAAPCLAQSGARTDGLEQIVVSATRTERDIDSVPATVSILSSEEIERQIVRDIRDLVRYEPGVSVGGTGDRFGLGGFTIRGIGGNRVLTLIDGVRVADAFSFGPFLSANRDYVDVDALEAFEVVRGPGSALYGSDAIGGVVAFRTKDPVDYLDGNPFYGGVKAGYSGVDDGRVGTLTLAGGTDRLNAMLLHTRRDAAETENFGGAGGTGPAREIPDPIDSETDNTVLKLGYSPSEAHALLLGADLHERRTQSRVLSNYDTLVGTTRTLTQDADDRAERERISLAYTWRPESGSVDRFRAQVYTQSSSQAQHTRELRESTTSGALTNRARDSFFDQDIDGLNLQVDKALGGGGASHYVVAGAEMWTTDSAGLRDGGTTDAATGAPVFEFSPLPTRDFPPTGIDQKAVYVQDEIGLLDGRLSLTPSLRYDSFDANAVGDAIYFAGNPGQAAPEDFEDSEVSPKLGLLYALTDRMSLYAQYAEGFKAPPYSDVNVGFTNPIGGYKTISNPDLESERSRSRELGLRLAPELGRLSLVVFRNRYDNFIESFLPAAEFAATGGVDPADGFLTFQSQNIAGVEIEGFEVSGRVGLGAEGGFALDFALAYAEGTDVVANEPLDSIDPAKGVLGLNYASPEGRWGGDLVVTLVAEKAPSDISGDRLPTAGYGLVDVLGYYHFAPGVRLNFGLFNLGDRRYVQWADTPSIAFDATSGTFPEAARFTQPGFNAGMTLRVEF